MLQKSGLQSRGWKWGWAAMLAALTVLPGAVQAQDYPSKPIKIIVPFPPGGHTDILGRLIAQKMTTSFGQSVIIENRPGANGIMGSDVAARAPADGYT